MWDPIPLPQNNVLNSAPIYFNSADQNMDESPEKKWIKGGLIYPLIYDHFIYYADTHTSEWASYWSVISCLW